MLVAKTKLFIFRHNVITKLQLIDKYCFVYVNRGIVGVDKEFRNKVSRLNNKKENIYVRYAFIHLLL